MSWSSLPAELHVCIFQYLVHDRRRQYQSPYHRQWERNIASTPAVQSQYAAVNREWQSYFEAQTFKYIILEDSDVLNFGKYVMLSQRGALVRWIWLRITLPSYGCDRCHKQETEAERRGHEAKFTHAIWDLLNQLSRLGANHPGLALELSVHSPSDSEHYCQELKNTINDTLRHASEANAVPPRHLNNRRRGWSNGRRGPLPKGAYLRVFGSP